MGAEDEANYAKYFPKDLDKDKSKGTGQDYFTIPILDLKAGTPYAFNFQWVFPNGSKSKWSDGYTVTTASYTTKLTKPTITVTAASLGYIVSYTKQTDKNFDNAIIEEAVSNSNTDPGTGYQEVGVTSSNPITITVGSVSKRWVRLKLTDKIAGNTAYSDAVSVTPVDPVAAALDITPPSAASGISAVWSSDNILITATVSADAKKFIVRLTNGSSVGFFTKFPSAAGTSQTILITSQELYNTFGQYFTSFSGLLTSADSLDNRDSGVAFSVAEKTNELNGVTPTFTVTSISNGYTVVYTLPAAASYAKVYASGTSGFTPNDSTNLVYSGSSPGVVIDTSYSIKYVKIKYFKIDGSTSSISAEQSVTPSDPGMLSLIDNEVKISTSGSILAGDSAVSGGRGIFNKTGIYFYDTAGNATSQLITTASGGSPTLITTSAKIADWIISSNKIENTLHAGTTQYSGLSPSGTYAFWAGSTVSGGNSAANFSVTPAGAVIAKNITITGGSLTVGASSIAASTGKLISTDAEITGAITANSGSITGNFGIGASGTFFIGSSASSGDRILINSGGIAAYASGVTNPRFELAKDGTGKIGGWTINATSLSASGMVLNSGSQQISFTNGFQIDNDNFTYNIAGSTVSSSTYYAGDSETFGVVGDGSNAANSSFVSLPPGTASGSSINIKPSAGYNATTSPGLFMSTSGYSTLQGGGSYISFSSTGVVINTNTVGGIAFKGFASAVHSMYDSAKESGAVLQIFSDGRVSAGRAFYRSGASESSITNINHVRWPGVGLIGDVIFSTAD
jgi:hypothetical protein